MFCFGVVISGVVHMLMKCVDNCHARLCTAQEQEQLNRCDVLGWFASSNAEMLA